MPLLTLSLSAAKDGNRAGKAARILTDLTARHLGKAPEVTAVIVHEHDPARWFIGAEPLAGDVAARASFALDVKVTAGTNTKAEISAYIDAVFAAMGALTGAVRTESYIVVDEVPAPNWGFGGRTQEHRFIAGRRAEPATELTAP
ncbi:4-oxalocrotonate tautomerase [Rhodobium orientis]|uniref:4-oxalocrotonate tautomerase-like domain-containing protein n=1 Tax=Rhodobium orientis TaxID=34017 RepID=A0A327JXD1_9HYPH|nr:tautomerase family protein [Rhodobium orientis]MBB4301166.1 4-oxalocrotonate tautomerase [Rhodobium orientis]MBK5949823.1 hypothetical protein [Rhodobium orientis]RAI30234.1 hypothetical protein CH339_00585 [Rhodobium orientis]